MKRSPHDKYKVYLTEKELQGVNTLIKKGICKARTITRARILLAAHEGKLDKEICAALETVGSTVHDTKAWLKKMWCFPIRTVAKQLNIAKGTVMKYKSI